VLEFKTMVRELHRHGIEVILDVVYNHTGEGTPGSPAISWRALDRSTYYLWDDRGAPMNLSGCGNSFNANHPVSQQLIVASLRYWAGEMGVDGFRFDLASLLTRNAKGMPMRDAPVIDAIATDPGLRAVKLIAEPWDAAGLYHVGSFGGGGSNRWAEWNGRYRDDMRHYLKGSPGYASPFATRLCGSKDLYAPNRTPVHSVNFLTAHDGFTLADLCAYNHKHNIANGEDNRDGCDHNNSWNCGVEGVTDREDVINLRRRQQRNALLALFLSQGVPILLMGDEYGHTKGGNNNTWCQDNALNWFLWQEQTHEETGLFRFVRELIALRKKHQVLASNRFFDSDLIEWHGGMPHTPDWAAESRLLAFTLYDRAGGEDLYAAFNAGHTAVEVVLPLPRDDKVWMWIVDTAKSPPHDFVDKAHAVIGGILHLPPSSAVLLGT